MSASSETLMSEFMFYQMMEMWFSLLFMMLLCMVMCIV